VLQLAAAPLALALTPAAALAAGKGERLKEWVLVLQRCSCSKLPPSPQRNN
jgi:hypothetical protein